MSTNYNSEQNSSSNLAQKYLKVKKLGTNFITISFVSIAILIIGMLIMIFVGVSSTSLDATSDSIYLFSSIFIAICSVLGITELVLSILFAIAVYSLNDKKNLGVLAIIGIFFWIIQLIVAFIMVGEAKKFLANQNTNINHSSSNINSQSENSDFNSSHTQEVEKEKIKENDLSSTKSSIAKDIFLSDETIDKKLSMLKDKLQKGEISVEEYNEYKNKIIDSI